MRSDGSYSIGMTDCNKRTDIVLLKEDLSLKQVIKDGRTAGPLPFP